ncbi:hypothetical protein [Spirillospora sp. NBC_01491]|nr:hypothetical protein [Spirillospora sp. NBC_01491]
MVALDDVRQAAPPLSRTSEHPVRPAGFHLPRHGAEAHLAGRDR